jgi:hypothetical protein
MAAGEGPAKEPNRRVNMEAMVGNWLWRNGKKALVVKVVVEGAWDYIPWTSGAGGGGCDFRSK